ncbi:MAG: hypothetical protein CVV64_10820 [Candidatus Wallbacteria bacterium HGW-Wallbacteria-1]|jgi:hypothetical protein|uniref:Zinc-finger domain-containing protein n=1 Tax=Candidatus Wallbacteria bacterium HGW-Wallbacteria-1 TaxID=2013854 RepID=A0A2N1PPK3_9BACT|nr:MAG: hypothetical protein CVV64_10820 [Candidatus Wallbacteria bacterium HGW-Wallbacteria-1]
MQCDHLDHYLFLKRENRLSLRGHEVLESHLESCENCRCWIHDDEAFRTLTQTGMDELIRLESVMMKNEPDLDQQWRVIEKRGLSVESDYGDMLREGMVVSLCLLGALLIMSSTGVSFFSGFSGLLTGQSAVSQGGGSHLGYVMASVLPGLVFRLILALTITAFGLMGRHQGA